MTVKSTMMAAKRAGDEDDLALVAKRQRTDGGAIVPVGNASAQPSNQLGVTSEVCSILCFFEFYSKFNHMQVYLREE